MPDAEETNVFAEIEEVEQAVLKVDQKVSAIGASADAKIDALSVQVAATLDLCKKILAQVSPLPPVKFRIDLQSN